jgi:hypothetical protein
MTAKEKGLNILRGLDVLFSSNAARESILDGLPLTYPDGTPYNWRDYQQRLLASYEVQATNAWKHVAIEQAILDCQDDDPAAVLELLNSLWE